MNLLIKIPTRERGFDWLADYINNITNPNTEIWLTLDEDSVQRNELDKLCERFDDIDFPNVAEIIGESKSKIDAVNRDIDSISNYFNWDIILIGSDDMQPMVKGFDQLILDHFQDTLDKFLWSYDGRQPRICTIPIMGRDYYNRFGYIYHPSYKSFFCDNEQTEVALRLGKCHRIEDNLLSHEHPAWQGTRKQDALYTRNDKFWNEDYENYKKRKKLNFPI